MSNTLRFDARSVYGRVVYYPANAEAMAICKVAGLKTLDTYKLNTLNSVFQVEVTERALEGAGYV